MQIYNRIPPAQTQQIYTPRTEQPAVQSAAPVPAAARNPEEPDNSVVISISKSSRVFYALSQRKDTWPGFINMRRTEDGNLNISGVASPREVKECQTCKNRKYVDQSNDPTVSFRTPTNISPEAAASAVAAHEGEHIRNERANAEQDGRKVVSQSVIMHTSVCPECGRVYVSGGEARTVTVSGDKPDKQDAGTDNF